MALYPRMRDLREDLDYSQAKMAAALGLYKTTYARYESGEREAPAWVIVKLAEYYCVSTDYLLGLERLTTVDVTGLADRDVAVLAELAERLKNCKD